MQLEELTERVEAVSLTYAKTFDIHRDSTWFLLKLQEEVGELTQAFLLMTGQGRDRGRSREQREAAFRAELADVCSHVLLLARHHQVDLEAEIATKWLRSSDRG